MQVPKQPTVDSRDLQLAIVKKLDGIKAEMFFLVDKLIESQMKIAELEKEKANNEQAKKEKPRDTAAK